jgi:hypothetical protein
MCQLLHLEAGLRRSLFSLVILGALCAIAGCGNSTTPGTGAPSPSNPNFVLSLASPGLSVTQGTTVSLSLSTTGSNGFSSPVSIQLSGLPSGVTYGPTPASVTPGSSLSLTITAAATAATGQVGVTVTGSSGSLSHTASFSLTVKALPVATKTFRTRYTRTDSPTEYPFYLNDRWMVFDAPTNRFFVSDPNGNQIVVLDATKEAQIATIPVPGAYGIDETPDHSVLYAGTEIGDVYAIDPVAMKVTQRYQAAQIGTSGYAALAVRVLANGDLALLGSAGGIPSVDGSGSVAVWKPATNAITVYGGTSQFCVRNIGAFTLTGDRSLIVTGSIDSDGTLCTLDPTTGVQNSVPNVREFIYKIAATPDGKSLLVGDYNPQQIVVLDSRTLQQTNSFATVGDTSSAASYIVSPDSRTLYIGQGGILYAYDLATGTQSGWLSTLTVEPVSGGGAVGPTSTPNLQAFDGTGLLAGPMEEGVGFLDTTTLQTTSPGIGYANDYMVPATGPASGGTSTTWSDLNIDAAWLGGNPMASLSQTGDLTTGITPVGLAGPVDLYAQRTDGGMRIVPEAFSYGPTILEVTPSAATAEGTGTGTLFGYGFGPTTYGSTLPPDFSLTVGGTPVTVTGFDPFAYGVSSPPFNLQSVSYAIPPGAAGFRADVKISLSSGEATASAAMSYLPGVKSFPLAGAQLAQGIYDAKRDLYYFTDASQVQVFSRTNGAWLKPLPVPAAPPGPAHRLYGIALSQDGSKLAISDNGAGQLYLLDPDSPGTVQTFPVPSAFGGYIEAGGHTSTFPSGLAVSNSGSIYYAAFDVDTTGDDGFFKLDTNTGKFVDYGVDSFSATLFKVAITADNTRVFFNDDGAVFSVDTATDKVSYAKVDTGCCYGDYDLTLSPDQKTLEATSYLYDGNLNAQSYLVLNDREALNIAYVYGTKLSADGALLFQPSTSGIDVYDGRLGTLRSRISLPFDLSQNYDALVSDGQDNITVAITGKTGDGIAVVDLTSISEPPPLTYAKRRADEQPVASGAVAPLRRMTASTSRTHIKHNVSALGRTSK